MFSKRDSRGIVLRTLSPIIYGKIFHATQELFILL